MSLDHLSHLRRDADALADAVAGGDPDAPIAGCPGWTLIDLAAHLGRVHRWARAAIVTGGPPEIDHTADPAPTEPAAMAQWLRDGADRLIVALEAVDPQAPTWHPFPVEPKVAGLWPRRQAQETFVHRIDAELAVGRTPVIDAELAADGIDEYWTVMLPRLLSREGLTPPQSVVAVRLTDRAGEWVADGRSGVVVLAPAAAPAATISGDAAAVLLQMWGRPLEEGAITVEGDTTVADAWLALGGA